MSAADIEFHGSFNCHSATAQSPQVHYSIKNYRDCKDCASLHSEIKEYIQGFGIRLEKFLYRLEMLFLSQQEPSRNASSTFCNTNNSTPGIVTINEEISKSDINTNTFEACRFQSGMYIVKL